LRHNARGSAKLRRAGASGSNHTPVCVPHRWMSIVRLAISQIARFTTISMVNIDIISV
jgi:hypothetical protein